MATLTSDLDAVQTFINQVKIRDCYIADDAAPTVLQDAGQRGQHIPYMSSGAAPLQQCYITGWPEIEGAMLLAEEQEFNADCRVIIAANSERALRDLLTTFPAGQTGFFYLSSPWMLDALEDFFEGQPLPACEGYFATAATFISQQPQRARRLTQEDYPLVEQQWSESVWDEMLQGGYAVHACTEQQTLQALCFQWPTLPHGHHVHGLQAVTDFAGGYAEAAVASATAEVIEQGKTAFCGCNLASDLNYLRTFRNVGYRLYYRVHSFLGIKRGTGSYNRVRPEEFLTGSTSAKTAKHQSLHNGKALGEGHRIATGKDPVLTQFRDLSHTAGRREYSQFVAEGRTLVQRALNNGLPVECLLYSADLMQTIDGVELLALARHLGIEHFQLSTGLLGTATNTRPLPDVIAAIRTRVREVEGIGGVATTSLLIVDNVQNPDNLGMIIRSADAAGVEAIVVVGDKTDPLHKNCVRAARGAVGRLPIFRSSSAVEYLHQLSGIDYRIIGATGSGEKELFGCDLEPPLALVVGNEQDGISPALLQACTDRVRIPMAPGQDSLNVGVASGILLYESLRQRLALKTSVY